MIMLNIGTFIFCLLITFIVGFIAGICTKFKKK